AEQEGQQTETEATGAPQKHHYTLNQQVGSITGGIKAKEGSKNISKAINLLPTEIEQLQQLVGKGVEVEIRQVPNDRKQLFAECV
ncbi:PTS sugar transporter subunit IIB, partial [Klebsiella pneumoniae]|nr:PTS sugar transporter subunit IIB [Klebsiella pneumoniae]MCO0754145.1 PTS sugar transporter subunit IIB [Klebsiella pneumoniae]